MKARVGVGALGGGLLGAVLAWGGGVLFFPETNLDAAFNAVFAGFVAGAVAGGLLAWRRSRAR